MPPPPSQVAENLNARGLRVTVVEQLPHVMPPLDEDLVSPLSHALRAAGIDLVLGEGLAAVEPVAGRERGDTMTVVTTAGRRLPAGLVLLTIGVRPESGLAEKAGIDLGVRGVSATASCRAGAVLTPALRRGPRPQTIAVNEQMQTSDPHVWAVGDVVQSTSVVTGSPTHLALAGPANRQGRVAAGSMAGRRVRFRGVQGTAVCGVCGLTVALTGITERALTRAGADTSRVRSVHLHPGHHVGYYPGAHAIHMKVAFDADTGRLIGAQGVHPPPMRGGGGGALLPWPVSP